MAPWVAGLGYLMGSSGRRRLTMGMSSKRKGIGWPTFNPSLQPRVLSRTSKSPGSQPGHIYFASWTSLEMGISYHYSLVLKTGENVMMGKFKQNSKNTCIVRKLLKCITIHMVIMNIEETVSIMKHIGWMDKNHLLNDSKIKRYCFSWVLSPSHWGKKKKTLSQDLLK